jgi:pimeloyl-ACP methyl ester carboxylesterase
MAIALAMPRLGMTMREGTVVEWRAAAGDPVARGQIVLVIESEKAEVEIESPAQGRLAHVYVPAGETVPSGTLLAAIAEPGDAALDAEAFRRAFAGPAAASAKAGDAGGAAPAGAQSSARRAAEALLATPRAEAVRATPAARRLARELGVDLDRVAGTGPGGRITREDVEAASAAAASALVEVRPGVRLEVFDSGAGAPVLLVPGFGSDVRMFARLEPELAQAFRVRALHPRGVGRSDALPAAGFGVRDHALDVAALADPPAHLVGASLGAAIALELALAQPERVRSLVLVTPFLEAGPRLLSVVSLWARLRAEASPELLAEALLPWLFGPALLGDAPRRAAAARALAQGAGCSSAESLARSAAGLAAWSGSRARDVSALRVPTLVVGGGDDLLTPDAAAVARAIPGAELALLPGAAHAVLLEAAGACTAIVEHLRRAP